MSDFWDEMRRVAEPMRNAPAWMKGGIILNPQHFVTWPGSIETEMRRRAQQPERASGTSAEPDCA